LADGLKKKSPGSPRERAQPQLPPSGERWGCLGEASPLHSLLVILTLSVVQAPLLATRVLCYLRGLQRDRPPGCCPRLPSEHLHSPAGPSIGSRCPSDGHALRRPRASACYCVCPPVVCFIRSQFHWVVRQRSDGPASHAILLYWWIVCL